MQINLVVKREGDAGAYTITCDLGERLVFGRNLVSPVNFSGSEISREHFVLFSRGADVCVQDLSSNGTNVNGRPVPQNKVQKLGEGDVISVPGYEIKLWRERLNSEAGEWPARVDFSHPLLSVSRWRSVFSLWEIAVIAAAMASFTLIIAYFVL